MPAPLVEQARAKINLTLRVAGRRADGYHDLESLVAFADLADTITLHPENSDVLVVSGAFSAASGPVERNLVLEALDALRQRIEGLKAGRFFLEKNIPVAAGLGGGSADAAAALRLLARANDIALDDRRLAEVALSVGADVPVCLESEARIMRGVGEILSPPVALPKLAAVLVNPGVPLATRDVFAKLPGLNFASPSLSDPPRDFEGLIGYLGEHGNGLTEPATACVPVIAEVLTVLGAQPGARLVRMSGSGATCFALFATRGEASAAAKSIEAEHKDWWVRAAVLG